MATQADLDWEQYQLGQQGTATGSGMNQMGLSDRPQTHSKPSSQGSNKARKAKTAPKAKAQKNAHVKNTSGDTLEAIFGFIAFAITGLYLYQPADENGVASLIVAGIAGVIIGKLYKIILAGLLIIGIIYLFAYAT